MAPLLDASRVAWAALAVGVGRAAYEYALEYAKNRKAFGEAIAQRQSIAFMLAEMATELEAARLLVWEAAWLLDQGRDASREAYLARNLADDMALMVSRPRRADPGRPRLHPRLPGRAVAAQRARPSPSWKAWPSSDAEEAP